MPTLQHISLALLRIGFGWFFFYSGITKVLNPTWSAAAYLENAQSLIPLYQFFLSPSILPIINSLNAWGQLLIGVALLLGVSVRAASLAGIVLMLLYYFPVLRFPFIGKNALLVDQHILYSVGLFVLFAFRTGQYFGLGNWCSNIPLGARFPRIRSLLS